MKRWFGLLVLVTVMGQAVFNGGRVLLSWRVLDFGGSAATVGWFTAAFSLVPLLIALPAGKLVDSRRATEVMYAGLIATVIAAVVMALSANLPVLLLGYVTLGFAHLTTLIAAQGMVSHLRGGVAGLDSLFAYFTLGISIGQFLGIVGAGLLTPNHDGASAGTTTTGALWAMAIIGAVALVIGWPVATAYRRLEAAAAGEVYAAASGSAGGQSSGADESPSRERTEHPAEKISPSLFDILRYEGMSSAMTVSIAVIVAIDLLTAYVPVLGRELGFSVAEVTAILGARSGLAIVSRAVMPTVLRRANRDRVLIVAVCAGVVPMLAMPWLTSSWMMVIAVGICGLAWGFVMPMSMTWVSSLVSADVRAQALSIRLMGNRLAQVVLPPVAGLGAAALGAGSVFLGAGALLGVASAAVWKRLGAGAKSTL
ncbi:MAG: MFS transporter [Corynebacterium sp.]|uniref:MFS transporter n=1 Tax=Corynebacterium sp. TaxID=1720 RepID=UPI0026DAA5B8|nr:MFS transporter [Corynebacterium sp.]MDO5030210.1 MFS transporter [Corynebacterium sp.]